MKKSKLTFIIRLQSSLVMNFFHNLRKCIKNSTQMVTCHKICGYDYDYELCESTGVSVAKTMTGGLCRFSETSIVDRHVTHPAWP
jgi:hypothetical protein